MEGKEREGDSVWSGERERERERERSEGGQDMKERHKNFERERVTPE